MINLLVLLLLTFSLQVGQVYNIDLVKCYDGDTCTINVDLGFNLWLNTVRVRLINIDTPEIIGTEKKMAS